MFKMNGYLHPDLQSVPEQKITTDELIENFLIKHISFEFAPTSKIIDFILVGLYKSLDCVLYGKLNLEELLEIMNELPLGKESRRKLFRHCVSLKEGMVSL